MTVYIRSICSYTTSWLPLMGLTRNSVASASPRLMPANRAVPLRVEVGVEVIVDSRLAVAYQGDRLQALQQVAAESKMQRHTKEKRVGEERGRNNNCVR